MNVTIKHYKHSHPDWNTVSLRQCIFDHQSSGINDNLCNAFKKIHHVAFEMAFRKNVLLSIEVKTQATIKTLGFVTILNEESTSDEVKLAFSHPTFIEFFAALHLVTLPQKEQLFRVQHSLIKRRVELVKFYFGLLGDFYANNITALSAPLKQFSIAYGDSVNKWEHACPPGFYTAYSSSSLIVHKEISWKGEVYRDLLKSAGIVVNASACVSLTSKTITSIHHMLTHAHIHKLSIINYSDTIRAISLEDTNHALNSSHLRLLDAYSCLYTGKTSAMKSKCISYTNTSGLESSVTYCHLRLNGVLHRFFKHLINFHDIKSVGLTIENFPLSVLENRYFRKSHKFRSIVPSRYMTISTLELHSCYEKILILLRELPIANISTLYMDTYTCTPLPMSADSISNVTVLKQLQNLIIRHESTSPMNASLLISGLTSLKYLRIEKISSKSASQIINAVSKQQLIVLELIHCYLRSGLQTLAKNIHQLTRLQNLNFEGVFLRDHHVSIISTEGITGLMSLSYLGLANNRITGKGLHDLVAALRNCKRFRSLNLYLNPITGRENIAVLSQLTNLHALHITVFSNDDKNELFTVVNSLTKLKSFKWSYYHGE